MGGGAARASGAARTLACACFEKIQYKNSFLQLLELGIPNTPRASGAARTTGGAGAHVCSGDPGMILIIIIGMMIMITIMIMIMIIVIMIIVSTIIIYYQ